MRKAEEGFGRVGIWRFGDLEIWRFGDLEIWDGVIRIWEIFGLDFGSEGP